MFEEIKWYEIEPFNGPVVGPQWLEIGNVILLIGEGDHYIALIKGGK